MTCQTTRRWVSGLWNHFH